MLATRVCLCGSRLFLNARLSQELSLSGFSTFNKINHGLGRIDIAENRFLALKFLLGLTILHNVHVLLHGLDDCGRVNEGRARFCGLGARVELVSLLLVVPEVSIVSLSFPAGTVNMKYEPARLVEGHPGTGARLPRCT